MVSMSPRSIRYDDLVISAPGNLEAWRVPVAAPQVSWEINGAGSFSAFVRLDDLRAVGLAVDLKGYWVDYPTMAGRWGGVIVAQPTTDGTLEISAQGFVTLVQGRVIAESQIAMSGSAGGLARRALELAGAGNPTFLAIGMIDEGGGPLAMDLVGDVGSDILPQIAEAGDVEWVVNADRSFQLARRLGTDRSSEVRLVEDVHIVQVRVNDDLASVRSGAVYRVQNELSHNVMQLTRAQPTTPTVQPPNNPTVPASPAPPSPTSPAWMQNNPLFSEGVQQVQAFLAQVPNGAALLATWLGRHGFSHAMQQQLQTYTVEPPAVLTRPTLNAPSPTWSGMAVGIGANNPAVAGRRHAPPPTLPAELTLADIDGAWSACGLGDTVRIDLGSLGTTGRFRTLNRALDVGSQTLTVSGEFLRDD